MFRRIIAAVGLLCVVEARADSWALPERETYHSTDGRWRLVVTPKQLKGQLEYFTDKVNGAANAGAGDGIPDNGARGELYHQTGRSTWRRVAGWHLVNEVSPVSALVASDGTVVTFDNWHGLGQGDDVVVIYRSDGRLVRKLGLADLIEEEDIVLLRRSVSSIHWSGTHRIDEQKRVLLLEVKAYKLVTLPISLDTGALLEPGRVVFPKPRVTWTGENRAGADCDGAIGLSGDALVERAVTADVPYYPEIARKARISGSVIVEITIGESGAVERTLVLKSLPFGIGEAAHDSVKKWRFRPMDRNGTPVRLCGLVRMDFDLTGSKVGD